MIVPANQKAFLPIFDELALLSGGKTFVVEQKSVIRRYREVSNAFSDVVSDANKRVVLHERIVDISSSNNYSEGEFIIDASLGKDTQFGIYVEDEEDHLIKSVQFTDSAGTTFGPYSRVATTFDNVNMKTVNYGLTDTSPFKDGVHLGKWSYRVEWYAMPGYQAKEAAIVISSRKKGIVANGYKIRMWTSSDGSQDIATSHHPLAVYVSLHKDGMVVLRAAVAVHTTIVTEDGAIHTEPIHLFDNSNGDPDITGNDVVYSRCLK